MANPPERREHGRLKGFRHSLADPFERLQDEMDRLFSGYARGWVRPRLGFESSEDGLIAHVDMSETPESIVIEIDVPGIKEEDIDLRLNDSSLTVKGKRESGSEEKKKNYHRIERSYGEFQRTIPLPCEVDRDNIQAGLKKGVLTVTLQKTQKAMEQETKIKISSD